MVKSSIKKKIFRYEARLIGWVIKNRYSIFTWLFLNILLAILAQQPYLNLIFYKISISFFAIISALIIFKVRRELTIVLGMLMLMAALPLLFLKENKSAELLADFAYGFLFLGILKFILGKNH